MGMPIWRNVNVWIWKYNIIDMCIEYLSYGNVVLRELYPYDSMIRKEHNYYFTKCHCEKYREKNKSIGFGLEKAGSLH